MPLRQPRYRWRRRRLPPNPPPQPTAEVFAGQAGRFVFHQGTPRGALAQPSPPPVRPSKKSETPKIANMPTRPSSASSRTTRPSGSHEENRIRGGGHFECSHLLVAHGWVSCSRPPGSCPRNATAGRRGAPAKRPRSVSSLATLIAAPRRSSVWSRRTAWRRSRLLSSSASAVFSKSSASAGSRAATSRWWVQGKSNRLRAGTNRSAIHAAFFTV